VKFQISLCFVLIILFALPFTGCTSRDPNLENQVWQLVSYGSIYTPIAAITGIGTSLTFDKNGTINAHMGCNYISGDYIMSNGKITFNQLISTMMACPENGVSLQESALISAFKGPVEYLITGNTLTIYYKDRQQMMTFAAKGSN
jgi:heat shock protein HslJ